MNYPKGIDISFYQNSVDYSVLCKNVDFIIMKCGEKDYSDPLFETHYKNCSNYNITLGAYFYGRARSNEEAKKEAQLCASLVKGKNFTLPIFYDVEGSPGTGYEGILYPGPYSGYTVNGIVRAFFDELSLQGVSSYGIYSSASFFPVWLNKDDFTDCYIWAAAWGYSTPPLVWGREPDIWQYSKATRYPGFDGNLDGDYLITTNFPLKDNKYYFCHPFGMKALETVINTYEGHGYGAIDLSLPSNITTKMDTIGTPIYSLCDGTVLTSTYNTGSAEKSLTNRGGNSVTIKAEGTASIMNNILDRELQFLYCHMVNPNEQEYRHYPLLKPGDKIRKGQIIGGMGASGNTDDGYGGVFVHLHLETQAKMKTNTKAYNKYRNKIIHFDSGDRTVGDNYNYAIFCESPILTWMNIDGITEDGVELFQMHNVPNEYYNDIISENQITNNGQYSHDYMMNIITALSIRETIGYANADISDFLINCVAIYGKLLRARCIFYPTTSLMEILNTGGFTGFNEQSLESRAAPEIRAKLLELVSNNFIHPGAYGILSEYIPLISYAPFFNYGYAGLGYQECTPSIEQSLSNKILSLEIESHIKNGNTTDLSGCCGNTGYFPPRAWV